MTASIAELVAALRGVIELITTGMQRLRQAASAWDEASSSYQAAIEGSTQVEVHELSAIDAALRSQIDQIMALLGACGTNIETAIRQYGGGGPGHAPVVSGATSRPSMLKAAVDDEKIAEVRRTLRSPSPRGAQTTGWVIRSDGSKDRLLSGPDDDPSGPVQKAERLIRQYLPPTRQGAVALARHVEVKVAMRMRESGSGHEVVVVDKKVCGRSPDTVDLRYTCDRYLSFFIPEGAVLTVIEHDGTQIDYRGRGPR